VDNLLVSVGKVVHRLANSLKALTETLIIERVTAFNGVEKYYPQKRDIKKICTSNAYGHQML
jgi:hypothetical protein